jgi:exopolyphosphatase / guanosine-5'-triphosphate,3'-diphosphate pyrophosphatase
MRCAILDLGSNSFHILVADLDGRSITPVLREREMLHLGRVVASNDGRVPDESRDLAVATVAHLMELARRNGAEESLAVATAALRDADNGTEVLAALSEAAGIEIQVLDGLEEARLAYLGVRASVAVRANPVLVFDLGGGSLEFAIGVGDQVVWSASTRLGASGLSATVGAGALKKKERRALHECVDEEIDPLIDAIRSHSPKTAIAVGGTVRALARIVAARRAMWMPATLNQFDVDTSELGEIRDELIDMDLDERLAMPGMKDRRADHVHIAAVVLARVFERLQLDHVTVSDWGLREGLLLDAHGETAPVTAAQLRVAEVERIRTNFVPDDPHPVHVAGLARQLFDCTGTLHRLGDEDRELLDHAARLHAIGEVLALRRQHIHGAYLVENSELRGFSPTDAAILSTLVRFQRSTGIDATSPAYANLDADDRSRADRLLPLLQAADGFDRAHDQAVTGVAVVIGDGQIEFRLAGGELHTTRSELDRKMSLFERTFGVEVRVSGSNGDGP